MSGSGRDLHERVAVPPYKRQAGEPILSLDQRTDMCGLVRRKYAHCRREFRARDFPADGAGGDLRLRIISNPFALSQLAVRHEVKFVVVLYKPDRRVHGDAALAIRGKSDVALAVDLSGDGRHLDIVERLARFSLQRPMILL
jgi:hypothetical protein